MKKRLLSAAIILTALVGFNASAQQQTPDNQNANEMTSKQDKKADKKDKKDRKDRKFNKDRKAGRHGQRPDLFKGIELSAEQKAQLDALRPQLPEGAPKKEAKVKCNETKCDSAACVKPDCGKECCKADLDKKCPKDPKGPKAEGRRHGRPEMGKGMREEYVNKVKEILTTEQFEIFQKNISELRNQGPRHADKK